MPISRGSEFGEIAPLPADAPVVADDWSLRELVLDHRRRGVALPTVGLLGGDLCRTLGGVGDRSRLSSDEARTFRVDLGTAVCDGRSTVFVAHLVVGRPFAGGTAVLQAQWLGDLDMGPRAHPADGRLDVTSGRLGWRQRRTARRRARTGSHLPHPDLEHRQLVGVAIESVRPRPVVVDGRAIGRFRRVEIGLEPEALLVVV
ncbi:MAG: hypothetical protein FGM58_07625 [Acidimicrobiia bacterium]|nr:hypothetical protein [Acidimicrobiia bacterium]